MRRSIASGGDPKGAGGNVGKRVSSGYNRRRRLATRSSGKQQAGRTAVRDAPIVCPEESPLLASTGDNFAVSKSPRRGLTRRLRRELGLAVPWGAHTFLSVAKEKCAKESQRHGDSRGGPPRFASRASSCGSPSGCPRPRFASLTRREKGVYCPFWRRGSLCRAQRSWPAYACYRARSELAFFRRQNGRAFFPPLPIAALLRRSWRGAYADLAGWDVSMRLGDFAAWMNGLIFFSPQSAWGRLTPCGLDVSVLLKNDAA